ncbi:MAG: hypothetical protein LBG97_06730 [Coriobacteriales bacterium]|jgi:hypothetical protein|nr:hypothetical protein [Coriobacteriales bacterium]
MKVKKRLALLGTTIVALALVAAMSFAWFTSSLDPINLDITAARIRVENVGDNTWSIGGDESLLGAALPGETVSVGNFAIKNTSNREAVAQIKFTKLEGKLKFDNSNLTVGGTKITLEQLRDAINASVTLTNEQKAKFVALIDVTGGYVTVNQELFDFAWADYGNGAGPKVIGAMVDNGTQVYYSIFHFWAVLNDIFAQINDNLYNTAVAYNLVIAPTDDPDGINKAVYYLGLGIPVPGVNDELTFNNLSFKVPEELGGNIKNLPNSVPPTLLDQLKARDYNWDTKYFNEQESTISIEFKVQVVQGTLAAVTDVFGNPNIQNTSNPIWTSNPFSTFLTNN